jgi:CubicO group peptidase (beta-lactamase class C family)
MRLIASAAACVVLFTAIARAGTCAECSAPAAVSDGWPVSLPAQQRLGSQLICSIGPGLVKLGGADPHGVVVIRHGVLVYEQYFTAKTCAAGHRLVWCLMGIWHGRQIVSAGWIKQMTAQHSPRGLWFGFAGSYGYRWWQGRSSIDSRDIDWVGGLGQGGQRLFVVPNLNLVVAVTTGLYGESHGGAPSLKESLAGDTALNSFVLPAALGH